MILNNIKKVIDSWIKMGKIICDQIIKKYVNILCLFLYKKYKH